MGRVCLSGEDGRDQAHAEITGDPLPDAEQHLHRPARPAPTESVSTASSGDITRPIATAPASAPLR